MYLTFKEEIYERVCLYLLQKFSISLINHVWELGALKQTTQRLKGCLHKKNSHWREFRTRMTFWSRFTFTWWLGHFICRYVKVHCLHVNKIHVWFKIANITHALPVPVYRQMFGRFAFTWYLCEISYRSDILAPVQQLKWTHPRGSQSGDGMAFGGGIR